MASRNVFNPNDEVCWNDESCGVWAAVTKNFTEQTQKSYGDREYSLSNISNECTRHCGDLRTTYPLGYDSVQPGFDDERIVYVFVPVANVLQVTAQLFPVGRIAYIDAITSCFPCVVSQDTS